MEGTKKIKLHSELVYLAAMIILSFAVSMVAASNFGVSMIVAPAYILSQKLTFLTFGQAEYVVQSVIFIVFCMAMKKVKIVYFSSYITCLIYGLFLDAWRAAIPVLNPNITEPGSMAMPVRIIFFVVGVLLTTFSVALFFNTYLYPQVYDFFVKGITDKYGINLTKFKTGFDFTCLTVACIMTLVFFKKFIGVGVGTLIMTVFNGTIIGFFNKLINKYCVVVPLAPKFAKKFDLTV